VKTLGNVNYKKGKDMNEVNKVVTEDVEGTYPSSEEEGIPEYLKRENLEEVKEVEDPQPGVKDNFSERPYPL
jgi:hypothetical protein